MSPSEEKPRNNLRGYSILEVLISLAIIGAITTAMVLSLRPLSPTAQRQMRIVELDQIVADASFRAVEDGSIIRLEERDCEEEPTEIRLFPDGTASPSSLCVLFGDQRAELHLHPFLIRWEIGLE
ncbi:prepilin-type N-terminal cleavage/methylation domain-containing protein [Gymnodinialimonas sp.]